MKLPNVILYVALTSSKLDKNLYIFLVAWNYTGLFSASINIYTIDVHIFVIKNPHDCQILSKMEKIIF